MMDKPELFAKTFDSFAFKPCSMSITGASNMEV